MTNTNPRTPVEPLTLKPCAFCNGSATFVKHSAGMRGTSGFDSWHAVACKSCGATIGASDRRFRSQDEAAKVWNKRLATPLAVQAADEREALIERLIDEALDSDATGRPHLTLADTALKLQAARTQLTQAPAALTDLLPLQRFASAVMESWPGGDLDGGDLQNTAEACGLIAERTVRAPCCDEGCGCAEAGFTGETQCYVQQPILHRAHRASANGISHKGKDE